MRVIYSDTQSQHAPAEISVRGLLVGNLELPIRAENLRAAAAAAGHEIVAPRDFGEAPILAIHDRGYIEFLKIAYPEWTEKLALRGPYAASHGTGIRAAGRAPTSIQGKVGYYLSGGSVPMDAGTWEAAHDAAYSALEAAQQVLDGAPEAYAICRPPGHHAYTDLAGGFCYLNNVAIAAEHVVQARGRAAILDIDVHHGNGTQEIFYERGDVHFVSIHADTNETYPFFVGYSDEIGRGGGEGANLNLPLPKGFDDDTFLQALNKGLAKIADYAPPVLLVSLGFDAYEHDPQQEGAVSVKGFFEAGKRIASLGLPTVLVQEGGYSIDDLGATLDAFLEGFATGRNRKP